MEILEKTKDIIYFARNIDDFTPYFEYRQEALENHAMKVVKNPKPYFNEVLYDDYLITIGFKNIKSFTEAGKYSSYENLGIYNVGVEPFVYHIPFIIKAKLFREDHPHLNSEMNEKELIKHFNNLAVDKFTTIKKYSGDFSS